MPSAAGTTVKQILRVLRSEPSFGHALPDTLDETSLVSLQDMDPATQQLWLTSTCTIPMLVPAEDCWGGPGPDFHEIFEAVWKEKSKDLHWPSCYDTHVQQIRAYSNEGHKSTSRGRGRHSANLSCRTRIMPPLSWEWRLAVQGEVSLVVPR